MTDTPARVVPFAGLGRNARALVGGAVLLALVFFVGERPDRTERAPGWE